MRSQIALWMGLVLAVVPLQTASASGIDDVAARAVAAHQAKDGAALRDVAHASQGPSIWQLIEILAADGQAAAAVALADVAQGSEAIALRAYARLRKVTAPDAESMRAIRAALDKTHSPQAWHEAFGTGGVGGDGIDAVWVWMLRGGTRTHLKHSAADISADYLRGARLAVKLGAFASALDAYAFGWKAVEKEDNNAAIEVLREYLRVAKQAKSSEQQRRVHLGLYSALRKRRDHEAMLPHALGALANSQSLKQKQRALSLAIMTEVKLGLQHATGRHLRQMREVSKQLGDEAYLHATDVLIASNEASLGRPAEALARLERSLTYFEKQGNPKMLRGAHLHAAVVSNEILDSERSLRHIKQALHFGKGLGYNDGTLRSVQAEALLNLGRIDEAVELLKLASKLSEGATANSRLAIRLRMLYALSVSKDFAEIDAFISSAYELAAKTADPRTSAVQVDHSACLIYQLAGRWDDLIRVGTPALANAEKLMLFEVFDRLNGRLAHAWLSKGEPARAIAYAEKSVSGTLRRSTALPDRAGALYRSRSNVVFGVAFEAAVRNNDIKAAFSFAERACAVSLRNRLGQTDIVYGALDKELRVREIELQEAETAAVTRYRRAVQKDDSDAAQKAAAKLGEVRVQLDRHRERIVATQSPAALGIEPPVDSLQETQQRLKTNEVLVLMASGTAHLYAMVVRSDSARIVDLGNADQLQQRCEDNVLDDSTFPADKAVTELQRLLITPLKLPAEATQVTLVPTGPMSATPFAALLMDREVTLLPSVSAGRLISARAGKAVGILAVGDPESADGRRLPAARAEAKAIGDVLLLGKDATEQRLRETLVSRPRWRAVHIACHGLIDPTHPLRSALSLTPTADSDGLWTVSEILQAKVPTSLAVLGSCSTGRGKHFDQEGTLGFVHAFFVAGAQRVIVSLWDMDDKSTSVFLRRFHKEWVEGTRPATALQRTRVWMRKQPQWKHPVHWASWQLWGPR